MLFEKFVDCYHGIIIEEYKSARFKNVYKDRKLYTAFMNSIMQNKITVDFFDRHFENCKLHAEYFKIDYTWWESAKSKESNVNIYDWKLLCAVEHENQWDDWTYEVEKLDSINAPLKIVIGYMPKHMRDKEIEIVETQASKLKNRSNNQEFGVILLNRELDVTSSNPFDIRTYLIKESKVERL